MDRAINQQVKDLLRQEGRDKLIYLCKTDKRFWDALRFSLFETDENVRWPAIEITAQVVESWWREGCRENVRDYILSFQINDEDKIKYLITQKWDALVEGVDGMVNDEYSRVYNSNSSVSEKVKEYNKIAELHAKMVRQLEEFRDNFSNVLEPVVEVPQPVTNPDFEERLEASKNKVIPAKTLHSVFLQARHLHGNLQKIKFCLMKVPEQAVFGMISILYS